MEYDVVFHESLAFVSSFPPKVSGKGTSRRYSARQCLFRSKVSHRVCHKQISKTAESMNAILDVSRQSHGTMARLLYSLAVRYPLPLPFGLTKRLLGGPKFRMVHRVEPIGHVETNTNHGRTQESVPKCDHRAKWLDPPPQCAGTATGTTTGG